MLFFIAGGTGFVGRHLIHAMSKAGIDARCLARSTEKAGLCKKIGYDAPIGDITDRESLKGKLEGCDIVVHLVGILEEKGSATYEGIHVEGTRNLVDEAQKAGVKHIFFQSALGASSSSSSMYYKTKAEAENIIIKSAIGYTIFRPSLIIGKGDGFTEKLKGLLNLGPLVPIPGDGNVKMQPIYIEDWIKCFFKIFAPPSEDEIKSGIYEFGGPEHLTLNDIVAQLMEASGINKPVIHIPSGFIKLSLPFSGISSTIAGVFGKKVPTVTAEQLDLLQSDNICDRLSVEKGFGFSPITYRDALKIFIKDNN